MAVTSAWVAGRTMVLSAMDSVLGKPCNICRWQPNVEVAHPKDGAARAPHETCLRQGTDAAIASPSSGACTWGCLGRRRDRLRRQRGWRNSINLDERQARRIVKSGDYSSIISGI
jgi:hypothetical protein